MQKGNKKSVQPKIGNNGGRAYVTVDGQRVYLKTPKGETAFFGTPLANEAYHRLLAEKAAGQMAPAKPDSITLDDIEKTLAESSPTLAAVVRVQLANAARPSEVLNMRIENIDRTNPDLWTVIIPEHKNSWRENAADKTLYLARPEQCRCGNKC